MKLRRNNGSTLGFIAASTLVLCGVGAGVMYAVMAASGTREAVNAADAGVLNVAQKITTRGVKLANSFEVENFGAYVNGKSEITLENYNRVVAHAMLAAINARKIDQLPSTPTSATVNASQLVKAANEIGARLSATLDNEEQVKEQFAKLASANSTRMLTSDAEIKVVHYEVGFAGIEDSSNVYFDKATGIDPSKYGVSNAKGSNYVAGYSKINVPGMSESLMTVPVNPDGQPHLISKSLFLTRSQAMAKGLPATAVPNAFFITAEIRDKKTGVTSQQNGIAMVGVRDKKFAVAFPHGYVAIVNPAGYRGGARRAPSVDNIFNNELATGIFLAKGDNGGVVAFSANVDGGENLLSKWAAYNSDPTGTAQPPVTGKDGKPLIYLADGSPATSADQLKAITGIGSPQAGCYASNVGGDGAIPQAAAMLPAFQRAYDHDFEEFPGDNSELTAVEQMKQNVWDAYAIAWPKWNALNQKGLTVQQANVMAECPVPSSQGLKHSALALFDHSAQYAIHSTSPKFTKPGSAAELCNQIGAGSEAAIDQLADQVHQIKPEASKDEVKALINSTTLPIDSTQYIYMADETSRKLVCSPRPPKWSTTTAVPDGKTELHTSKDYGTVGTIANPSHDRGIHDVLFYQNPDRDKKCRGYDQVGYTPCSGHNNCVAIVEFRNTVTNIDNSVNDNSVNSNNITNITNITQVTNNTNIFNNITITSTFYGGGGGVGGGGGAGGGGGTGGGGGAGGGGGHAGPTDSTPVTFAQPN